jgi:prevent-host-death family protein
MRSIRVSENVVPVSEFKAQAADWLKTIASSDAPVVVTQNGRPAAVMLSPKAYDALTEQARFVAAVNEGLADVDAGRLIDHDAVTARLRARFGG